MIHVTIYTESSPNPSRCCVVCPTIVARVVANCIHPSHHIDIIIQSVPLVWDHRACLNASKSIGKFASRTIVKTNHVVYSKLGSLHKIWHPNSCFVLTWPQIWLPIWLFHAKLRNPGSQWNPGSQTHNNLSFQNTMNRARSARMRAEKKPWLKKIVKKHWLKMLHEQMLSMDWTWLP